MISKLFDVAMKMSSLSRYSQTHLIKEENVLEHTGFVAMAAYMISIQIDGVDIGLVLRKAIVHDIDEIVTGDIPRPTKYANETIRAEIEKIEHENMLNISKDATGSFIMYSDWSDAKNDTIEGMIIKISDLLAVLYKIWQEVRLYNNKTIQDHSIGLTKSFEALQDKTDNDVLFGIIAESIKLCDELRDQR